LNDLAKLRTIRRVSIWVKELGVVENVEELSPEIDALGFGYLDGLQYCEVGIADVRPATERTASITKGAE
jgi:hypothetical protein